MEKKRLVLIDGMYYVYRSFLSNYHKKSKNKYSPVYLFIITIKRIIKSNPGANFFVAFDGKGKTYRSELLNAYKANRPKMDPKLIEILPKFKQFLSLYKIPQYTINNYEADDLIATLAKKYEKKGKEWEVLIYTSDKDLLQLISTQTSVFLDNVKKVITINNFEEEIKLKYKYFIAWKAIAGDSSDNIKGVPGIGKIGATKLLNEFAGIENLLNNIDSIKNERQKKLMYSHKDKIRMYMKIIKLITDIELSDFNIEQLDRYDLSNNEKLRINNFYKNIQIWSIVEK